MASGHRPCPLEWPQQDPWEALPIFTGRAYDGLLASRYAARLPRERAARALGVSDSAISLSFAEGSWKSIRPIPRFTRGSVAVFAMGGNPRLAFGERKRFGGLGGVLGTHPLTEIDATTWSFTPPKRG